MNTATGSVKRRVIQLSDGQTRPAECRLVAEEPLSIRVEGKPYAVVMRTPGEEIPHVAGFCLTEGLIDTPDDVGAIAFCDGTDTNVVAVTLAPAARSRIPALLDRRGYVSQTSCGICGKELVEDLEQLVRPLGNQVRIHARDAVERLLSIKAHQPLREATRGAHGTVLYDAALSKLVATEDVGRHNALDKAIGTLFLAGTLPRAAVAVLSSRISYELVQKAARARISIILALSRPTSLAASLAEKLNMTLACHDKKGGIFVICGEERLRY